jgi:phosphotransferase system HPr-like phosphotransfer protein
LTAAGRAGSQLSVILQKQALAIFAQQERIMIMKTVSISLNSIDKVKSFVNDITKFDNDFDLVSGRYVIDAKSIMGIFSLDLSKPINLNIQDTEDMDEILKVLEPYIIK